MSRLLRDITWDENGKLQLSADALKQWHALGAAVADTETTGLNQEKSGLTELVAIRAMTTLEAKKLGVVLNPKSGPGGMRLIAFQAHVLPQKPNMPDYVKAKAAQPETPFDREQFEYDISPRALAVTNTDIIREKGRFDVPIKQLRVDGTLVKDAARFDEVMDAYLAFTDNGNREVFFNAPFDKRMIGQKIAETNAYHDAVADRHLQMDGLPNALRIAYEDADAKQRAKICQWLGARVQLPAAYRDPSQWRCLYHAFRAAHPSLGGHRLDDAVRHYLDANFDGRGAHSALEDVLLAGKVMLKLSEKDYAGKAPNLVELYGERLKQYVPDIKVHATPSEHAHRHDIGFAYDHNDSASTRLTHVLESAEKVHPSNPLLIGRNPLSPGYVIDLESDAGAARGAISTRDHNKRPRAYSALHQISSMLALPKQHAWLTRITPYDSPGSYADVTVRTTNNISVHIADVPWVALRSNLRYIDAHPEAAAETLTMLRDMMLADERIGKPSIVTHEDGSRELVLRGHVREFGTLRLNWPKGYDAAAFFQLIKPSLEYWVGHSIVPFATEQMAKSTLYDESPFGSALDGDDLTKSAVEVTHHHEKKQVSVSVDPLTYKLMQFALPEEWLKHERSFTALRTQSGLIHVKKVPMADAHDAKAYRMEMTGPVSAFSDFVQSRPVAGKAPETVAERPSNIMRNAAWLAYRLRSVAGTADVDVSLRGREIVLHQHDGVSPEALQMLMDTRCPFIATARSIRIPARYLVNDAFDYTLAFSRWQGHTAYAHVASYATALHRGQATRLQFSPELPLQFALRDGSQMLLESYSNQGPKLSADTSGISRLQSDLEASTNTAITYGNFVELSAWQRALLECCLKENNYPLEGVDLSRINLSQLKNDDGLRDGMSEMLRRTSGLRAALAPLSAPLKACELTAPHSASIRMDAITPCQFGDLLADTTQFYDRIHRLKNETGTNSLSDGMRSLRRNILPLAESFTKRRETDPFELIAGHVTPLLPALKTMVGTMSEPNGTLPEIISAIGQSSFSGQYVQGSLNFSGRIAADITRLSRLQDMARELADSPRTSSSEHDALMQYAQHCATAQSKLLTAHFALQRLQEACGTVTKKVLGSGNHSSLMDNIATYFEQSLPERMARSLVADSEQTMAELLAVHDSALRSHYGLLPERKPERTRLLRSISLIAHMPADDALRARLQEVGAHFLRAAFPKVADHDDAIMESIHHAPSDWISFHSTLGEQLADLPKDTRRKLTDTITCLVYPAKLPEIEYAMMQASLHADAENRCKEWEAYGRTFLKLAAHYASTTDSHAPILRELAVRCFKQAGYGDAACQARLAKQKPATLDAHALAKALDKLANRKSGSRKHTDQQTAESWQNMYAQIETRMQALTQKSAVRSYDYVQNIRRHAAQVAYNPNFELQHSRDMMRSAKHLADELDDAIKIYRHSIRNLSAAMLLLRSDPAAATAADATALKLNTNKRTSFPEPSGISQRLIPDIHDGSRLLHTLMLSHAQQTCETYGIPARTDGDQLVFDTSLLLAGDARSKQLWHQIMATPVREQATRETIVTPIAPPTQQRHLVFDSSALIPYLALADANPPENPFHAGVNIQESSMSLARARLEYAMLPLTCLTPKISYTGPGRKVDSLIVPDHVFYEVTGILAASQPQMLSEFALYAAAGNYEQLEATINRYVAASPRLNLTKSYQNDQDNVAGTVSRAQLRAQLKCLVTYIALHPEALVKTKVGSRYSDILHAEYTRITEPLGTTHTPKPLYAPSLLDIMTSGIDLTRFAAVRVHVRQLVHMGWLSEAEYKASMQFSETEGSQKKRFVQVDELLKRLHRNGALDEAHYQACLDAYQHQLATKGTKKSDDDKYLTFGTLAAILPSLPESLRGNDDATSHLQHAIELASHSKLLMEQYFYAGIFPRNYERAIAAALGVPVSETSASAIWQQQLKEAGFYERSVHVGDLQQIDAALEKAGASNEERAPIQHILGTLAHENQQRAALNRESMYRATNAAPSPSTVGTPIEKMLSDSVVNGAVNTDEFLQILAKLRPIEHGHLRAQPATLMKSWHGNIQLAQMDVDRTPYVLIMRDGANARMGNFTVSDPHTWPTIIHERMPGDVQDFVRIPLYEVIRRARDALEDKAVQQRYHRIIEALIFPIFSQENGKETAATRLSSAMREVLGSERTMQVFKDFQTRHMRKAWGSLSPDSSVTMGAHIHARLERHNLGEAAVLEASNAATDANPGSKIYAVTHDHSLMHSPEQGLTLDASVRRQHSAYQLPATSTAAILPTRQFAAWTDTTLNGVASKHTLTPDFEQEPVRTRGSR